MTDKIDRLIAEVEARRSRAIAGGQTLGKTQSALFTNEDAVDVSRLLHDDIPTLAAALKELRAAVRGYLRACCDSPQNGEAPIYDAEDKLAALVGWERGSDD